MSDSSTTEECIVLGITHSFTMFGIAPTFSLLYYPYLSWVSHTKVAKSFLIATVHITSIIHTQVIKIHAVKIVVISSCKHKVIGSDVMSVLIGVMDDVIGCETLSPETCSWSESPPPLSPVLQSLSLVAVFRVSGR